MARFFCFRSILRAATTTTTTRYAIFKPAFWGHFVHKHIKKLGLLTRTPFFGLGRNGTWRRLPFYSKRPQQRLPKMSLRVELNNNVLRLFTAGEDARASGIPLPFMCGWIAVCHGRFWDTDGLIPEGIVSISDFSPHLHSLVCEMLTL